MRTRSTGGNKRAASSTEQSPKRTPSKRAKKEPVEKHVPATPSSQTCQDAAPTCTKSLASMIGQAAPTFTAPAVIDGEISTLSLESYRGQWVVLVFYPKDWTYVCPTELIAFSEAASTFKTELKTQIIAISTDTEESHLAWTERDRKIGGLGTMNIPLVADTTKSISSDYMVLDEASGVALRGLFLIDEHGTLQQITMNNLPVGRSIEETKRLIQAFQFHAVNGEVCPANWQPGEKTMKPCPKQSLSYFEAVYFE